MNRKFLISTIVLSACAMLIAAETATQPAAGEKQVTKSGLTIVKTGQADDTVKAGDQIWVHYTGKLANGTKFDSSYDRGEPYDVIIGRGDVIKGWDEGIIGMKVGEKRQLICPPDLAYGSSARGDTIPANATLVFDIQLMGLRKIEEPK